MLVRFVDDPTLLHWRGVLLVVDGTKVAVTTPDRDIEVTDLVVGDTYREIRKGDGQNVPRGVKERDTYLPRHSDKGRISPDEFYRLVGLAEKHKIGLVQRRRLTGRVNEPARAPPVVPEATVPGDDRVDEDHVFLIVYRSGNGALGEEMMPPGDSKEVVVNGKVFVLFSRDGEEFLLRKVPLGEIGRYQSLFQLPAPISEPPEKDVRVLAVLFDSADERWRTIQEAAPDLEEIDYDDFPLQGPRTIFHDIRQLRRQGLDFVQHHESWIKKSGVRSTDRSVHEHASLCRALNLMLCYDQLNLPGLASAEALNRRRALIEHAHSGRPDAPSYEGAEEILGIRETSDGSMVDPALMQHAARKQAARAEVLKQGRLAAEERRHLKKNDPDDKGGKKGDGKAPKAGASNP